MNEEEKKEFIKEVRSAVRSILIDITRADHEEIKRLRGRMVENEVNARLAEAVMAIAQAVKHHGEKQ